MTMLKRLVVDDQGGQSLIEFALMLPIVLLIITGLFDTGRAVWQENTLAYAAREGTRYAIVHGSGYPDPAQIAYPGNTSGITNVVRNAAVGVGGTITVTATWPNNCYDRSCPVAVEASAAFIPLPSRYLLNNAFQITLKGGSQLVIQR
jgi:Flp pilus assembly protein TadG